MPRFAIASCARCAIEATRPPGRGPRIGHCRRAGGDRARARRSEAARRVGTCRGAGSQGARPVDRRGHPHRIWQHRDGSREHEARRGTVHQARRRRSDRGGVRRRSAAADSRRRRWRASSGSTSSGFWLIARQRVSRGAHLGDSPALAATEARKAPGHPMKDLPRTVARQRHQCSGLSVLLNTETPSMLRRPTVRSPPGASILTSPKNCKPPEMNSRRCA